MKKILLLALMSVFTLISCRNIVGYNNKVDLKYTATREVQSFEAIRVSSIFNVYVTQDNSTKLNIKSTHDIIDKIKTEVENGELIISLDNDKRNGDTFCNLQIDIYISAKELKRVQGSGSVDIYSVGVIKGENIDIYASGASDIKLNLEMTGALNCQASGSSDIILSGNAISANIKASGSSDIDFKRFYLKEVKASASGSSDMYLNVSESIDVSASGASDVYYSGNPKITKVHSSGSSDIVKR